MNSNFIFKHQPAIVIFYTILLALSFSNVQAGQQEESSKVEFAIIGDMPYDARQRKEFTNLMKVLDTTKLAFVIHNGDFWFDGIAWKETTKGLAPCSDAVMKDRLTLAQSSKHPFIFVPGDNDWTDCHRAKPQSYDPQERLDKLRKMYFADEYSLGQRTIKLERQSNDPKYSNYPENVRWSYAGVMFVSLHMVGSNNNLGRTPKMDAEYTERNAANLVWMEQAFAMAERNNNKAVMIISHANPRFENTWTAKLQKRYLLGGLGLKPPKQRRTTGFDQFLEALEQETLAFGKPVVYAHGDTHTFRIDKPLVGSATKRMIENFTRAEVVGYGDTHWLRVIIDHSDPNVFSFKQGIVEDNLVEH